MREKKPGVWELRVNLGADPRTGKRRTSTRMFSGGKRDAQRALAAFVTETASGTKTSSATVADLLTRYLEHLEPRRSASTMKGYRRRVDNVLIPKLGKIRLAKLNAEHLDTLYDTLGEPHRRGERGGSPGDIAQYHAIMRGALNQAIKWKWVRTNVAEDAEPPALDERRVKPPSADIIARIIDLAEHGTGHPNSGPNQPLAVFLRLALVSGARRGELCALHWADIADSVVSVRRNIVDALGGGRWLEKDTKTHAERDVGINAALAAMLAEHYQAMRGRAAEAGCELAPSAYVFSHEPDGSIPWRPEYVTLAFGRLAERAGVKGLRLHDLRHASATFLLDALVPIHVVQRRLGHRQASTTLNIYGHALDHRDAQAAETLGAILPPTGRDTSPAASRTAGGPPAG